MLSGREWGKVKPKALNEAVFKREWSPGDLQPASSVPSD